MSTTINRVTPTSGPQDYHPFVQHCGSICLVDENGRRKGDGKLGSCCVFNQDGQNWCLTAAHVLATVPDVANYVGVSCVCIGKKTTPATDPETLRRIIHWHSDEKGDYTDLRKRSKPTDISPVHVDAVRFRLNGAAMEEMGFNSASLDLSNPVKEKDTVWVVGTPKGMGHRKNERGGDILRVGYFRCGVDSVTDRSGILKPIFFETPEMEPDLAGLSGSGVFNRRGKLVGMIFEDGNSFPNEAEENSGGFNVLARFYQMKWLLQNV